MIRLEGVTKVYPTGHKAVDNLSLEVKEGETCVLVGPSGCGKTTTMKMINRLIEPTEGKIYIRGEDIERVNPIELRRGIGYVIQEIGLFPHMTVAENVGTVPSLLRWPEKKRRERVDELLELVGMDPDEFRDKYPRQLSGGQRQRVGVARALGADPPILLMDEPFGAIDPITRERLQNEFLKIQAKLKKTIIFVTHDINEAIKMGDRIAIMRDGRLQQYAAPEEILTNPADEFVAGFVGTDRALKKLNILRVGELMNREVALCRADAVGEEVVRMMETAGISWTYVVDEGGRLMGYVNHDDAARAGSGLVSHLVRPVSTTLSPEATLSDALSEMLTYAAGHLCVVDDEDRVLGVITFGMLQDAIGEESPSRRRD